MFFLFYFACFIFIFARQYSQTAAHSRGFGFRAAAAVSLNALHLLAANRGQDGMVWDLSRWKGGVCRILIPAHSLSSPADHGGGGGSSVCPVCPRETSESAVRKAPFCPIHSVTVRTVGSVFRRLPASTVALLSAFPSQNAQCACVHVCVCVFGGKTFHVCSNFSTTRENPIFQHLRSKPTQQQKNHPQNTLRHTPYRER